MKRLAIAFSLLALAMAGGAVAEEKIDNDTSGTQAAAVDCPLVDFKHLGPIDEGAVIDNIVALCSAGGLAFGPVSFVDGPGTILDTVAEVSMYHTWAGDVGLELLYDETCDGTPDASVLLKDEGDSSGSDDLGDPPSGAAFTYTFGDAAVETIEAYALANASPVVAGCYLPAVGSMSSFTGMSKEGCWVLTACDDAGGDSGFLTTWDVHVFNDPAIPVEQTTWGSIKSSFQD